MDNPYSDLPYWAWQSIENCKILKITPEIAWALEVPDFPLAEIEQAVDRLLSNREIDEIANYYYGEMPAKFPHWKWDEKYEKMHEEYSEESKHEKLRSQNLQIEFEKLSVEYKEHLAEYLEENKG